MNVAVEWVIVFAAIAFCIYLFGVYFRAKSRANASILEALDIMEKKWDVLIDAGEDVPEKVMENTYFMLKVARQPDTRLALFMTLNPKDKTKRDINSEFALQIRGMRDPLQEVLEDFLSSWFVVVSNGNLVMRSLIRGSLGKLTEQSAGLNPVPRGALRAARRVKDRQQKNGACA